MNRYNSAVIGKIYQPGIGLCSYNYEFSANSDDDAVELAYSSEAPDFREVIDAKVTRVKDDLVVKEWDSEENYYAYLDTQSGNYIEEYDDE